uniref:Uncharacterized protein n=1 Tax=Magallana gigas TaxID=29159 RepID=K1R9I8_MAGGI
MKNKIVHRVCFFLFVIFTCPGTAKKGPCLRFPNGCCPYTHWDSDSEQCVVIKRYKSLLEVGTNHRKGIMEVTTFRLLVRDLFGNKLAGSTSL